ncbi:MAG: BatB protein, partial [Gammaproteobacteria bacterium]|nr:BatB protein [Gammaproteobacteria bacterium]
MFEWAWPLMGLLLPLPWLLRRLLPAVKNQQHAALRVPFFNELQQLTTQQPTTQTTKFNRSPWLAILIWCCLVLAIMRPQWLGEPVATPLTGRDLLVAVDVSGSMEVPDLTLGG